MRAPTRFVAACGAVVLVVSGCGRSSDGGVDAAAAPLTRPLGAFTAEIETRLFAGDAERGSVTERIDYVDSGTWTATVVQASGDDAPDVGSVRRLANGRYIETIPDVVDLLEYFSEPELDEFATRFGDKGPEVVAALVRDGILVPGDHRVVDEEIEGTAPAPHPLFELYDFDAAHSLGELDPQLRDGGGIRLVRDGDNFEYARDGAPLRYESIARGEVVAEAEVTSFERRGAS